MGVSKCTPIFFNENMLCIGGISNEWLKSEAYASVAA